MDIEKPIAEMLLMQAQLNDATNGPDWRSGLTQAGKTIDWKRCIFMETAELIDSYPWKHWKSIEAQTDIENVRVELVDIWHFLLSLTLEHFEMEVARDLLKKGLDNTRFEGRESSVIEQVQVHEQMMSIALEKTTVDGAFMQRLVGAFLHSCYVAELSFVQLYQIYMAKNVLNKFRQDHGYKEGEYIKIWDGKEDNVVMFEIIEQMDGFSGDALYIGLKTAYSQL